MLYFVSVSGISAGDSLDDYENFIVEAENEENLAAAIVADRMDDLGAAWLNGSVQRVRELGEEFDYNVNLEYVCKGERIQLVKGQDASPTHSLKVE